MPNLSSTSAWDLKMRLISIPLPVLLFLSTFVLAGSPQGIIINEIAWMGSTASGNDEWLELHNPTGSDVSLEGWTLESSDGSPKISLEGKIKANGFYLLERTDDNALPRIRADLIYKGALNNGGERLDLYDDQGDLVNSVDCLGGWLSGDNQTKQTMERKGSDWQNSSDPGGTPGAENSAGEKPDTATDNTVAATATTPLIFPTGIVINEVLPSPDGPDEQNEWIEIANTNGFAVDLSGWRISDTLGVIKEYSFPQDTNIDALGFLVLGRPESKIILNNDGDTLNLNRPDGVLSDSVSFGPAKPAESYTRTANAVWVWNGNPTPGAANVIPPKTESAAEGKESYQASAGEALQNNQNESSPADTKQSFLPLLFGLTLAVFFGILILFVKKRLLRYNN